MADLDDWQAPAATPDAGADDWVQGRQPTFIEGQERAVGNIARGAAAGASAGLQQLKSDVTTPINAEDYTPNDTGLKGEIEAPFAPAVGQAAGLTSRALKIGYDVFGALGSTAEGAIAPATVAPLQKLYEAGGMSPEQARANAEAATGNIANLPFVIDGAVRPHAPEVNAEAFAPQPAKSIYTSPVPANPVLSGPIADSFVSNSPIGTVLDAFGEGPRTDWGVKDITADLDTNAAPPETLKAMAQGQAEATKSFNEAFQRSAASTALVQAGPSITEQLAAARNLGIIGEGEAGWKGVVEPDGDMLAARNEAAKAIPQEPEPVPAPDIHEVARTIAPDVFEGPNGYDALLTRQDTFRRWIDELSDKRDQDFTTSPPLGDQIGGVQAKIDGILGKVNGVEDRLTKTKAAQLADLRDQHDDLTEQSRQIATQDTPDMQRVRQALLKNDYAMRDMAEKVSAAYREARAQMPPEETAPITQVAAETPPAEPVAASEPQPATATPATAEAAPGASPAPAEAAPAPERAAPSRPVPANVAADVSQKLFTAGRPVEEANAAGELVAAHYDARAARFGGALGTGPELYAREAPEVRAGRVRQAVPEKEFAQTARGKIAFRDARATITLMKDANASTFIHETGHQWLEEMMRDAADERAPADLTKDAQTVRDYLGAKHGEEISTRQHEKFARSFERYMMEGTAPSKGLADVFAKFKNWLTQIYQTVSKLRAPITDDIRQVFDRLLTKPGDEAVIAPEREPDQTFADLHEADALHTAPEHAAPVRDTVEQEIDQLAERKNPDIVPALAHGGETGEFAAQAGGDTGGAGRPEPDTGATGEPEEPGKIPGGSDNAGAEGSDLGTAANAGSRTPRGIKSEQPAGANARFTEPDSGLIDKAGNIRLDNLETPDDIKSVIRDTANANDDFFAARRGVISDAQALDLADALGMDASQLNLRKIGQAFNAEQILAARKLLVQSATAVRDAMIKAAEGSDADVMAYGEAAARHRMIQEQVSGITAEAGRALRAFRKIAGSDLTEAVGKVLGEDKDKTLFQLREEARLGRTLETPQQVSKFINDVEATRGEKIKAGILEYYINSLISGPITHMRYSVGNAVNALWTPLVEIPAAAVIGKLTGAEEQVHLGESMAQLYALGKGSRDGLSAAIEAFKTGASPPLPGEKLSGDFMGPRPHAIPGRIGDIINIPSQSVAAIHSFFKSLRYEQNIQGLAYRAAANEGLSGDRMAARIADLTKSPTEDMMQSATQDALKELYMAPTEYSSFMGNLNRAINSNLLAKIIVPFMKIGSEITRNAFIERTPLGIFSRDVRANLIGENGAVAQQMQAAKMAGGIALISTTAMMAAEGMATGDGPSDPKERATWLLTHQPNHLTIGNVSIPYQGLGSLGMLMRFSANSYETAHGWNSDDYGKSAVAALEGISKSVLDENFMRGVKDMLDAVYHPEEYGANYLRGFATNWIPFSVGLGQVAREIDPYHRQAKDLFDAAREKVPFVSESLHPRYDMFGQPMPNGGPPADYQNDPVVKAMADLHTGIGRLENKIRGVPLNDQQYDDFCRIAGRLTHASLTNLVKTPGFGNMPAGVRLKVMVASIDGAREQARNQIMMQSVGTQNDIIAKALAAKRAGMH